MLRLAGTIEYSSRHSLRRGKVKELPKWRYFLYETSPLHNSNSVRPDSTVLLPSAYFTKLRRQQKRNLNDVYHRFHKVRAILSNYYKDDLSPSYFLKEMNYSMNYLATNLFDYKFGQFYEERALLIFVDNVRILEKEGGRNATIAGYFLNYLLYSNIVLAQKINSVKDQEELHSQTSYHLCFKQYGRDSLKKYQYPYRLLHFMDRDVNYTSLYNKNNPRKSGQLINSKFQKKKPWETIQQQHRQELLQILDKQAPLLDNCKMSRLDYLCAVEYLISRKIISKGNLNHFYFYVQEDRKAKLAASDSGPTQFLQNMLLLNILGHLDQMTPEEKNTYKDFKYSHNLRKNYFSFYLNYLEDITPAALLQLLSHSSGLFPKYLVQKFTHSMKIKIEKAYIRMLDLIFDWYQQGDLLESNVNIAPFMEILLQTNTETAMRIMKKFEVCLLKKNQVIKKSILKDEMVPYYVMMRHGFKSDIMADQLLESTQIWWVSNKKQTNELLFRINIVLTIMQSDDHPQKEHLQHLFIQQLLSMEIWEPTSNRPFIYSATIQDFVAALNQSYKKNYLHLRISEQNEASKICKFLSSLSFAIKISKDSSLFDNHKEQFTQKLTNFMQRKRQKLKKCISYPRLLKKLFNCILDVGSENEKYFLLGLLSQIQQIIKEQGKYYYSTQLCEYYSLLIESPRIQSFSSQSVYSISNISSVFLFEKILKKKNQIKKSLNIHSEEEDNFEQQFNSQEYFPFEKEQERELSGQEHSIEKEQFLTEAPFFKSKRKTSRNSPFFKRKHKAPTQPSTLQQMKSEEKEQRNTQSATQVKQNKTKMKATIKRKTILLKKKSTKKEKKKVTKETKQEHQKDTFEEKQEETSSEVNGNSKGQQVALEKLSKNVEKREQNTISVAFKPKEYPLKKHSSRFLSWISGQSSRKVEK